ncbi:lipopolysaccharide assembly protein LapA domain-containing protein [Ilumatobacter fluminis]|nr:lipopolysaccharide assembly protein LapA domain-containing protein [Ilumatobacter fluminis]
MRAPDDMPTDTTPTDRTEAEPVRDYRGTGVMWAGGAVVVIVALAVIAAAQNTQDVEINFLWMDGTLPLVLLLLIAIGATVVVTESIGWAWRHRRRKRLREKDELKRLRKA